MKGRNKLVKKLRDAGVSDWDRKKIRKLEDELQRSKYYQDVAKFNKQVMGREVKPVQLSYENVLDMVESGKSVNDIIKEYKENAETFEQTGTTQEAWDWYGRFADELNSYGFNVTPEALNELNNEFSDKFSELEDWFGRMLKYELAGDTRGQQHCWERIEEILQLVNYL